VQPARIIVVACTPVESARLLLNSATAANPTGLANSSGQVGRNLMFSSGAMAKGFFPYVGAKKGAPTEELLRDAGMWIDVGVQDEYVVGKKAGLAYPKGGTVQWIWQHVNPIFRAMELTRETDPPLWGKALKDAMRERMAGGRMVEAENFAGYLPNDGTYVTVDSSVSDKYGLPVARIELKHHPVDTALSRHLQQVGARVLDAAGAKFVLLPQPGEAGYLQFGTCRFGEDPKTSVLDRNCRTYDVKNLFVTDGSFMPSSGGAPPTLTLYANATRVGRFIAAEAKAGKL
jgi:choline dehydrogenase-like flavoprotein